MSIRILNKDDNETFDAFFNRALNKNLVGLTNIFEAQIGECFNKFETVTKGLSDGRFLFLTPNKKINIKKLEEFISYIWNREIKIFGPFDTDYYRVCINNCPVTALKFNDKNLVIYLPTHIEQVEEFSEDSLLYKINNFFEGLI